MKLSKNGKQNDSTNVIDCSGVFALANMMKKLEAGKYGSASKDMKALIDWKVRDAEKIINEQALDIANMREKLDAGKYGSASKDMKAFIDWKIKILAPLLPKNHLLSKMFVDVEKIMAAQGHPASAIRVEEIVCLIPESNVGKDMGAYVGVESDERETKDDGLGYIGQEMSLASEYSKNDGPADKDKEIPELGLETQDSAHISVRPKRERKPPRWLEAYAQ